MQPVEHIAGERTVQPHHRHVHSHSREVLERQSRAHGMAQDRQEGFPSLREPRSTPQPTNGGLYPRHSPREEVLRHHSSMAERIRPGDSMGYNTPSIGQSQGYKSSRQDDQFHASRPASHPMQRSGEEYRRIAPRPSERPRVSEEELRRSGLGMRNFNDEGRPMPTQPIPSQGSRLTSQVPQQYQVEHRSQAQPSVARQHQIPASPRQAMSLEGSRSYAHPSPRSQVSSFDRPIKSSPSRSIQTYHPGRSTFVPTSSAQNVSPRLSMPNNQSRMFDYSGARQPEDPNPPLASSSMRPPRSAAFGGQGRPGSLHSADAVTESEARRQRISSHPERGIGQVRYAPLQRQVAREEFVGRSAPPRRSEDPLLSPQFDRERMANEELLQRTMSSSDVRTARSPCVDTQRASQMAASIRVDGSLASVDSQTRPVLRSAPGVSSADVAFFGERPASYRVEPERMRHEADHGGRSHRLSQPSTARSVQRKLEQDHRQQRQLEEERLYYMQQRRRPDPQHDPCQNEYDARVEVINERARREQHHVQAHPWPRNNPPSTRPSGLEEARQLRSAASGPSWAERPVKKHVQYVEAVPGRAVRPDLPSPRSGHHGPERFESSYRREERPVEERPSHAAVAQERRPEPAQRMVNGSSRVYADSDRAMSSNRGDQLQHFIIDGLRAPSDRHGPTNAMYRKEGSTRYLDSSTTREDPLTYREAEQPRNPSIHDGRPSLHPSPEHTRRDVLPQRDYLSQPISEPRVETQLLSIPSKRDRPHPPVIASQHSSLQPRSSADVHLPVSVSPPVRPLKRLRADSDTSLVLKTSRFTVNGEDVEPRRPSPAPRLLPSPLEAPRARPLAEQPSRSSEARIYHASETLSGSKSLTPLTAPPSK